MGGRGGRWRRQSVSCIFVDVALQWRGKKRKEAKWMTDDKKKNVLKRLKGKI